VGFVTVGLTGGIASGKSTVKALFEELGVPVVDADQIAREVVAPGTAGLREIVAAFGEEMLAADGTLDRKKLASVVFEDVEARARLNAITHPRIAARSAERMAEVAAKTGAPYVLYEAALLVENGIHRMLPALVLVALDEETQLARLVARDGLTAEEARARLAAQLPLAKKLEVADYVIDNGGTVDETRARVHEVHRALTARFGGANDG
jgi:dephospho-CoA kinase